MQTRNKTIKSYLELFISDETRTLSQPIREVGGPERAVMTTWKVSYEAIEKVNSKATKLLDALSFLSPSEIQEEITSMDKLLFFADQFEIEDALSLLQDFAFISVFYTVNQIRAFRMHRQMKLWTADSLIDVEAMAKYAIDMLSGKFEQYSMADLAYFTTIVPHVEALLQRSRLQAPIGLDLDQAKLLCNTARYHRDTGQFQIAADYLDKSYKLFEKNGDEKLILRTLSDLGVLAERKGQFDHALHLYGKAMAKRENILGEDHLDTLTSANYMTRAYSDQGQYDKALQWYTRAFSGYEKILGEEHQTL